MPRKSLFLLISCVLCILHAAADQDGKRDRKIISGHIRNAENGETLIGATLFVKEPGTGTACNDYGFYSVSLFPGTYTLTFSFLGFQNLEKRIKLTDHINLEIELVPEHEKIDEVTVTAEKRNTNISRIGMGFEKLQPKMIKSVPALMGEVDLIKAVQMLPGVQSAHEGSSGFSVRGGSPDQNLILLDEATVYNASHLMGFFSAFNNDAINDLKLYKGDVPAQYGGRLSSLLDVRMRDGNSRKISGAGGIGLISSRFTLDGPLKKDQTTFLLSGRRTYLDLFLPLSGDEDVRDSKLYFYDVNMKVSHRFNASNRLFVSAYLGRDVMRSPDFQMEYGNKTFTARWNHIFDQKLFMNATALWSKYDYELGTTADDNTDSWLWDSDLQDLGLKVDFSWFIKPEHALSFGIQSFLHEFDPGTARGIGDRSMFTEYTVEENHSLEHAGYLSWQSEPVKKLSLQLGIRASLFQNIGKATVYEYDDKYEVTDSIVYGEGDIYKSYFGLEPRLGVNYMFSENSSVKFSYNRSRQYIQQASNSTAGSPLDIWFSASPNIKPQVAGQWALGFYRNFNGGIYQSSVEAYCKNMKNTIDFADHADLLLNKYVEGEIRRGKSKAYGIEFSVKKAEGRLTGWLGYTLSRSERTVPEINNGKTYVAPFDKTHHVSVVVSFEINKRVSLSANWLYATGQPVTLPVQRYEINGSIVPYYTDRNDGRYDDYHRLDLSLTLKNRDRHNRSWHGEWVFSVYNVYNRKNTWVLNFKQDVDNPNETYAEKTYLFPIIPSVTYNFKF